MTAAPSTSAPPLASPTTRELLATLRATLLGAGAPNDGLRDFDAWCVYVVRLTGEPPRHIPNPAPLGDHAAARELAAEVSARLVRLGAGASTERRDALFAMAAAGERTTVACLDQYLLQKGKRRA